MERVYLKDGDYFFPSEPAIKADSLRTKSLLHRFNHTDPADTVSRQQLMKDLTPECGESVSLTALFYCSRGYNILAGMNFYCNVDCVILPEVKIGNDVVIAAGSVVTRDIPDRVIAGGVPARVLKYIQ